MEKFFENYYQTSLYHNENRLNCGLKTLPNKKVIFWVYDEIYFITDEPEKELLIELDIAIKSFEYLDEFTFFICSSESINSYLYFFNDDYTLNKTMNLLNSEFLLKLDINTFIFLEKSDKNKLVIMKILKEKEKNKKIKQYIDIIKDDIDISLNYKICKITDNKFLFYSETKDYYSYIKSYYIYTIYFKKNKFIIEESSFDSSTTDTKVNSFIALNEKLIAQFSIDDNKHLIIHLINIEILQIIYKYNTNIYIEENADLFEENIIKLYSKVEIEEEPLIYINYNIDEIQFFQLMKIFDKKSYDKYIDKINDLDKTKSKKFIKIFLRASYNKGNLYIIYFNKNSNAIYIENIDDKFCHNFIDILSKLEIKIVDDDYNDYDGCGGDSLGPYYFVDSIKYNEKDAIIVNEEQNYFILMFRHTNGWFHECLQIIGYSKK